MIKVQARIKESYYTSPKSMKSNTKRLWTFFQRRRLDKLDESLTTTGALVMFLEIMY